jgi:DNA-binding MarR family transcriptional regulator
VGGTGPTRASPWKTMKKRSLVTDAEFVSDDRRLGGAVGAGTPARPISYTAKQGQYLAFIYYYSKIHGRAPAEADFRRFFRVTPPVVHKMIKTLQVRGCIEREAGKARSIRLRLTRADLPDLE